MCVIVSVLKVGVVDMRVFMGLSVVTVFVLVLHMLMIMLEVSVRVRHILVRVLMSVRRGHPCPRFWLISTRWGALSHMRIDQAPISTLRLIWTSGGRVLLPH